MTFAYQSAPALPQETDPKSLKLTTLESAYGKKKRETHPSTINKNHGTEHYSTPPFNVLKRIRGRTCKINKKLTDVQDPIQTQPC